MTTALIQEVLDFTHSDQLLAQEFVDDRVKSFKKLFRPVKILVLSIVDYYLSTFYSWDAEAQDMCKAIHANPNEEEMTKIYKQFLLFLPVRLRSGVQGRYLFRQPSVEEKKLNQAKEPSATSTDLNQYIDQKLKWMIDGLTTGSVDVNDMLRELEEITLTK